MDLEFDNYGGIMVHGYTPGVIYPQVPEGRHSGRNRRMKKAKSRRDDIETK